MLLDRGWTSNPVEYVAVSPCPVLISWHLSLVLVKLLFEIIPLDSHARSAVPICRRWVFYGIFI